MKNTADKKEEDICGADGSCTGEIAIHTPQQTSTQSRTNNEIISTAPSQSNSNKENNALILHSPILSLLPNSNIKVCFLLTCRMVL